jgi:hypothetical protein
MLVPGFEVPAVLPVPENGMLPPALGAVVPDWPMPAAGLALPVPPDPVPGIGVDVLGCVAAGAGGTAGVLLPEPVAGALPVPPLLWASAGATIAATIARVARMLMTRNGIAMFLPGS